MKVSECAVCQECMKCYFGDELDEEIVVKLKNGEKVYCMKCGKKSVVFARLFYSIDPIPKGQ